jgi:hypothetical protein
MGRGSSPGRVKNFLFSTSFRSALWSTQSPIQSVPGVKRPGSEADHSPPASAKVKNMWIYTSTPPYTFMVSWLVYSCCSNLEHGASVKRFVSLQFLNLRQSVELLGRVISPSEGRYLTRTQTSMPEAVFEPTIQTFE